MSHPNGVNEKENPAYPPHPYNQGNRAPINNIFLISQLVNNSNNVSRPPYDQNNQFRSNPILVNPAIPITSNPDSAKVIPAPPAKKAVKALSGKRKKTTPPSCNDAGSSSSEPCKKKRSAKKNRSASDENDNGCLTCQKKAAEKIEISCQTESLKFMTQIGTVVSQDKPKRKSDFSTSLRAILRSLKEDEPNESGTSYHVSRSKVAEKMSEWFQLKCPSYMTKCPLCSEEMATNEKLKIHVTNSCLVLERMHLDMMGYTKSPEVIPTVEPEPEKFPDQDIDFDGMFEKEYFHLNGDLNLKDTCIFCGIIIEVDEESTDCSLRIDEHHLFNNCVVFQCFLSLLDTPQIKSITHVIGTTNTFLYFKNMIVFFAIGFSHEIYDPGFLREDSFMLISRMMKHVANSIMSHDTSCVFCSVQLKSLCVLEHHLTYCLCPVLKNFYLMIKQCLERKSAITGLLRRISVFYQTVLRDNTMPIIPKQSILDSKLCMELLDNAMYFRSLDPNFTLQSYKSPKDIVIAQKIEKIQQVWAEKVVTGLNVECPFCLTSFTCDKNLLRHIMFISCKNMKSVCTVIYNMIDFSEWSVEDTVLLQRITFIFKNQVLQGKLDVYLNRDQLKEFVVSVIYFLDQNPNDCLKAKLFSGNASSSTTPETPVYSDGLAPLVAWAKKLVKKKNTAVCPLCGCDDLTYSTMIQHIAMGKCKYINQLLPIILDCHTDHQATDKTPFKMTASDRHTQHSLLVDHIRRLLYLYNVNCKPTQFFVQSEFEEALLTPGSPLNPCYNNHQSFIITLVSPSQTTCTYCCNQLGSNDVLITHLSSIECPTLQFVITRIKKEWEHSQTLKISVAKIPELTRIHSGIFELEPGVVFSTKYLQAKTTLGTIQSATMISNLKNFMKWQVDMYDRDNSICKACNGHCDTTTQQTHLLLEEPVEFFCPEMRKFLDFHKRMICKKDNNGTIKAAFTMTDMLDLKLHFQHFSSVIEHDQKTRYQNVPAILSPDLKLQISASIGHIMKEYPEFRGIYNDLPCSPAVLRDLISPQMLVSSKLALTVECSLCIIRCQNVSDVSHHLAMFECPVLQMMIQSHTELAQVVNKPCLDTYKRLVTQIKDDYPKLNEQNLIPVFKALNNKHSDNLLKHVLTYMPQTNPFECKFCLTDLCSKGEIYTHYKKLQCVAQKECLGYIPNKKPTTYDSPFINVMCELFFSVYNKLQSKDLLQIRRYLNDVNSHADVFDFWCSNYCNTLIPTCAFCDVSLLSVNVIKSHPKVCKALRSVNEEIFGKDKTDAASLLQKKGLGSCRTSGDLPHEVMNQEEGMPFMQRHQCSKYLGWIPLCMDCVSHTEEDGFDEDGGTCRFLLFRRLMKRDGILSVFDFECSKSASSLSNWVPSETPLPELDAESAKYLLSHLLPHFNRMMASELWELENTDNLRLKHQVKNVRELCDSCYTTLFNIHLFCPRCGYVICMECYRDRLRGTVKGTLADCSDGSVHALTSLDTCVTIPPQAVWDLCASVRAVKDKHNVNVINIPFGERFSTHAAPHDLICDDQVLILYDSENPGNVNLFQNFLLKGNAIVVHDITKTLTSDLWRPATFSKHFGHDRELVVNCSTLEIHRILLKDFWDGFENVSERPRNDNGDPMVLKLKDWPTTYDFKEKLPQWFEEFMQVLPLKSYTWRTGLFNIARYLPDIYCSPDLGPKMYIAYSNANNPNEGSTVLHIDISDACNIIMYVGEAQDVLIKYSDDASVNTGSTHYLVRKEYTLREICEDTDEKQIQRMQRNKCKLGALWHIFHPNDFDKIKHFITKVFREKGHEVPQGHNPIHDQTCYLDGALRTRLLKEYGVKGWAIAQCEGDVVFIPAGAPHQVRNLQSCIKIAEDYVSPERVGFCFKYTEEIRHLTKSHYNHEDKLQVKNLLYHAVKECCSVLKATSPTRTEASKTTMSSQTTPQKVKTDKYCEQQKLLDKQEAHLLKMKKSYDSLLAENKEMKREVRVKEEELDLLRAQRPSSQLQTSQNNLLQTPPARSNNQPIPQAPKRGLQTPQSSSRSSDTLLTPSKRSNTSLQNKTSSQILRTLQSSSKRGPLDQYRLQARQYPRTQRAKPDPNSRDPRLLKLKTSTVQLNVASSSSSSSKNGRITPSTPEKVIPKSAFQGVQQHVQALRKNQPRIPKTPETPEPMDTNTDSCSPKVPDNLYRERNKNLSREIQILQRGESSQLCHPNEFQVYQNLIHNPRSRFQLNPPQQSVKSEAASNSETDSNEEPVTPFQGTNFTRYDNQSPATDHAYNTKHDSRKIADSPNYHSKSVNLMISSPKQPLLISKDLQKRKDVSKVSMSSLLDDVRNVMNSVQCTKIKEEIKTPPNKSPLPLTPVYNVQNVTPVVTPQSDSTESPITPDLSPARVSTPHTSPVSLPVTSPVSPPETPTNNGPSPVTPINSTVPSPCTPTNQIQLTNPLLQPVPQTWVTAPIIRRTEAQLASQEGLKTPELAPTLAHPSPAQPSLSSISPDSSSNPSSSSDPSPSLLNPGSSSASSSVMDEPVPGPSLGNPGVSSENDARPNSVGIGEYIKSITQNMLTNTSDINKSSESSNMSTVQPLEPKPKIRHVEDTGSIVPGPLIFDNFLRRKIQGKIGENSDQNNM